jgi:intracellular sulfur oxidation DsrE/DsrF family protein
MNERDKNVEGRRSLITGLGIAAAGIAATAATPAHAQRARRFEPARHSIDAWMDELAGRHRVFVDSATAHGGAEALLYGSNLYNVQQAAYSGDQGDFAMIVCFRHFSTGFGYNDAAWAKYGQHFSELMQFTDPATGKAPMVNLMNASGVQGLPNFGNTIDSLVAKGTQFAICNAATQFISQQIATATNGSSDDIYEDLVASAIPNSRFVPAGVIALTRAQEYGYSVLIAG